MKRRQRNQHRPVGIALLKWIGETAQQSVLLVIITLVSAYIGVVTATNTLSAMATGVVILFVLAFVFIFDFPRRASVTIVNWLVDTWMRMNAVFSAPFVQDFAPDRAILRAKSSGWPWVPLVVAELMLMSIVLLVVTSQVNTMFFVITILLGLILLLIYVLRSLDR